MIVRTADGVSEGERLLRWSHFTNDVSLRGSRSTPKATLALRRTTAEALCAARPLDTSQQAFVRELARPIVVLARRRDGGPESAWTVLPAHPDQYRLIHATEDVRIYRWEGAP